MNEQIDFKVGSADENKVKIQVPGPGLPIARSSSRGAMASLTTEEDSGSVGQLLIK